MPSKNYPLESIYFYLTKGCNLKCRHCWIDPKYQNPRSEHIPSLSINLFKSIIEQGKPLGLKSVKLTGGEPLMHPQISDLLRIVKESELNLVMETNGVLCSPSLAKQIRAASKHICISVSLDGADEEMHEWVRGIPGSFQSTINGIKNMVDAGIKPQIIMSVMRRNREQIEPVVKLAEELGAGSVKFNPIQPTARGDSLHGAMETLSIHDLVEVGLWVENTLSSRTTLRLFYTHPIAFRPLSKMYGDSSLGCGVCGILSILGVLSDGSYSICGIGETVPDLIFGNAKDDPLAEVWKTNTTLNELREGFPGKMKGICGDCLMQMLCKASCIAQNYYSNEDLWSPYWYCDQANKEGLFPKTRLKSTGVAAD